MQFDDIRIDTECDCLEGAAEDTQSTFLRLIDNTPSPKERDFLSHWERYKRQNRLDLISNIDCSKACGLKGLSLNKLDGYQEEEVFNIYTKMFLFTSEKERKKKVLYKFKMGSNAGVAKHTPNDVHDSHHDLYKCDLFNLSDLIEVSFHPIQAPDNAD